MAERNRHQPVMVIIAGPNGSGKSTLYHNVIEPGIIARRLDAPFLNADVYARERWGPGQDVMHSYEAAQEVARQRSERFAAGRSFVTETVFSHPSKLELIDEAHRHGFRVDLQVVVVPVQTSVSRVALRAQEGGHDVPEDKIRGRHARADGLLAQAIPKVENARIWRNDGDERGSAPAGARFDHQMVAEFKRGRIVERATTPEWMPPHLDKLVKTTPMADKSAPSKGSDHVPKGPIFPSPRRVGGKKAKGTDASTEQFRQQIERRQQRPGPEHGRD